MRTVGFVDGCMFSVSLVLVSCFAGCIARVVPAVAAR